MKKSWIKRDPIKNYFPVPNEIYSLGLSSDAISIYGYLLSREDRKTYQCLVSYRMISEAIGKCVTTVRKYVTELEERQLIRTEHTSVVLAHLAGRHQALQMCLRPHSRGVRGEAESAYPADECRAEDRPGPDAWNHSAGQTHKEAAADLGVYAAPSGRNQLQRHRQGSEGDPAYGSQAL